MTDKIIFNARTINIGGRCCGRKPFVYKRDDPHLFCDRCCRSYDSQTGEQKENWAYGAVESGKFKLNYPLMRDRVKR